MIISRYKTSGYKTEDLKEIKPGDLFKEIDTLGDGKDNMICRCIDLNTFEIIEPSERQLQDNSCFWKGRKTDVCEKFFLVRGLKFVA